MTAIIVTGHGSFASGFESMIALVLGKVEHIEFIDFTEGMSSDGLRAKLEEAYARFQQQDVVVFADIAGGTPFNQAAMMLHEKNKEGVLGGVSIPILLSAIELREEISSPLELCRQAKAMGVENITIFGDKKEKKQSTDPDDGI